ncbi:MAG: hypothetical protein WD114_04685 [Phycisphaerales bacterium]
MIFAVLIAIVTAVLGMDITVVFVAALVLIPLARHFDLKAQTKSMLIGLEDEGFVPCQIEDLDPGFVTAVKSLKIVSLRKKQVRACAVGVLEDREIVLLLTKGSDSEQNRVCCGIWSTEEWPKSTIRKRAPIIDLLQNAKTVGHPQFDKHRRLLSDAPELMCPLISELIRYFPTPETSHKSFRISSESPADERWGFHGSWIVATDEQIHTAEGMLQIVHYLVRFVHEAEGILREMRQMSSIQCQN